MSPEEETLHLVLLAPKFPQLLKCKSDFVNIEFNYFMLKFNFMLQVRTTHKYQSF